MIISHPLLLGPFTYTWLLTSTNEVRVMVYICTWPVGGKPTLGPQDTSITHLANVSWSKKGNGNHLAFQVPCPAHVHFPP